ncbi:S8 family peptidase [Phytomonospora endophytica]|uniref:Subtilisin family serine protease n=1 Tax=Phytomonospora endophytica TaxID=714109 RepID=A0A841FGF8_9ACTN|nr:S8 family serine peptidase [Phytomonospora endophytica]MBB6034725.1 subtilisin family serine protease [Phytomonospora endophytica]GIG69072.1 serine protease [Phytomonospora endophytica]
MRIRSTLAALGLLAAAVAATPAQAATDTGGTPLPAPADGRTHLVTLITGDKIHVKADGGYVYLPAVGREHIGYIRSGAGVLPLDAAPLVNRGLLDRALFDVNGLIEDGYADGADLPVIVQNGDSAAFRSAAGDSGLSADGRDLDSIDARALSVTAEGATELWGRIAPSGGNRAMNADVEHIWLDAKADVLLDQSVPQIGAPTAWEAGYDGTGVTVAVLDTGYDTAHPDLEGQVAQAKDFTGTSPDAADGHGHGTHVASTIAGTGAASQGRYKGVAPGATLLVGKVLDDEGSGSFSGIVDGMEWAASQGASTISMSLGGMPTDGTDPMALAVNELSARYGTLFTVAAGNEGGDGTVESPGSADAALTVGAVDKQDAPADFSSRGPRVGDYAVKPDISAPGVAITAAEAGTGGYVAHDGTSMATPHVAGAAAILKQRHPDWTGQQLKSALMGSAKGLDSVGVYTTGSGRVDVAAAIGAAVYAENAGVSFPTVEFPDDGSPKEKAVTYRNTSTMDVTVELAVTSAGTAGMFTVSPASLTVPAGGTARATVALSPTVGDALGTHAAVLTATAGEHVVRTPLGVTVEPELYDAHVKATAPNGRTVTDLNLAYVDKATGDVHFPAKYNADGSVDFRVPPGDYFTAGEITDDQGALTHFTLPALRIAADVEQVVDGSRAVPVSLRLKDRTGPTYADLSVGEFLQPVENGGTYSYGGSSAEAYTIPGENPGGYFFRVELAATIVSRDAAQTWQYNLYYGYDRVPTIDVEVGDNELGRQDARYESQGVSGETLVSYSHETEFGGTGTPALHVPVPGSRTVYFTPGAWSSGMVYMNEVEGSESYESSQHSAVYGAGRVETLRWNRAPLGVGLPGNSGVTRVNDEHLGSTMLMSVPLFTGPDVRIETTTQYEFEGTTTMTLDGETLMDDEGQACAHGGDIPADAAGTVTLTCSLDRDVPWSAIGAKSTGEWTFQTAPVTGMADQYLTAVRLNASGVENGYAKRGLPQVVALTVDHTGAVRTKVTSLTFEVSYDSGKTWRSVTVARHADTGVATLTHPAGATSVSVRMTTVDDHGNTSKQTTIGSWGLR